MSQPSSVSGRATGAATNVSTKLRWDQFDLVTNMLGITGKEEKAEFIGLTYRQLHRARQGEPVGIQFVNGTLAALSAHRERFAAAGVPITFEALFRTDGGDQ